MAAHAVGDYERASQMFDRAIPQLRAQGRLALLAQVLTMRAWGAIPLGDWSSAGSLADEGERLGRETVQPIWVAGALIARALLAGVHGDAELAESLLGEAEEITVPRRLGDLLCVGALARGVTALAAGRYEDGFDQLRRMFDPRDPAFHAADRFMGIGSLADAAVQSGHRAVAATILSELEPLATLTPSPALRFGILYARAILADDNDAEGLYIEALASELGAWPFLRARVQLGYGAWLRRSRRIAESRAPLRAARDTFDALGTDRWAERARQELRASGERSRRRIPETRDELTPQELQIATLAASGLSNRDIGQQLYLSPRTVASHLYRLFPKLGITSRSQLAGALRIDGESSVGS
jgi:ATP/maltotriose-dependent transcriptional regulator MalT